MAKKSGKPCTQWERDCRLGQKFRTGKKKCKRLFSKCWRAVMDVPQPAGR